MHHLNVKELAAWLDASGLDELTLTSPQGQLRLQRGATKATATTTSDLARTAVAPAPLGSPHVVKAPALGIFLHAHPLRTHSFAQAGDAVTPGQCLGLLQVGALLTPVHAHIHGVMDAYTQPHGSTVGYGTPLLTIHPV